jgi:hypothetical protein
VLRCFKICNNILHLNYKKEWIYTRFRHQKQNSLILYSFVYVITDIMDKENMYEYIYINIYIYVDGFGGLVISILATVTRVRGFKPGPKPLDFSGIRKILRMPSSGGAVKLYIPCPSFQNLGLMVLQHSKPMS